MMTKSALLRWIEEIESKLAELRAVVTQWSEAEEAVSAEALTGLEQEETPRKAMTSMRFLPSCARGGIFHLTYSPICLSKSCKRLW